MILETATLDIRPGASSDFERSFEKAQAIIARSPGYQRHELRASLERNDRDLLFVWWE